MTVRVIIFVTYMLGMLALAVWVTIRVIKVIIKKIKTSKQKGVTP